MIDVRTHGGPYLDGRVSGTLDFCYTCRYIDCFQRGEFPWYTAEPGIASPERKVMGYQKYTALLLGDGKIDFLRMYYVVSSERVCVGDELDPLWFLHLQHRDIMPRTPLFTIYYWYGWNTSDDLRIALTIFSLQLVFPGIWEVYIP